MLHLRQVFDMPHQHRLYINLGKCTFMTPKVIFLSYYVDRDGVRMDEEKVQAVREWSSATSMTQAHSFLGLATFY